MNILIINGGIPKGGRTEIITRFLANEYQFEYIDIPPSASTIHYTVSEKIIYSHFD